MDRAAGLRSIKSQSWEGFRVETYSELVLGSENQINIPLQVEKQLLIQVDDMESVQSLVWQVFEHVLRQNRSCNYLDGKNVKEYD